MGAGMTDDDYSKAPQSLAEIKAFKDGKSSLWKPRDMLIKLLRDIDNGELKVDKAIFIYFDAADNECVNYFSANLNRYDALAMLAIANALHLKDTQ